MNRRRHFRGGAGRRSGTAFTLVELLVVLAIIGIIAAITVSAYQGVNSAISLSSATQSIVSELTIARQTALTLDESVQVRFYQYADTTGISASPQFQAMQSFVIKGTTTNAIEKPALLPPNIMISSVSQFSSPLASQTLVSPASGDPVLPISGVGQNYKYGWVTFLPNGTIMPQTTYWFITLYEKKYQSSTPKNFTTVNLDPSNGRVRLFQP